MKHLAAKLTCVLVAHAMLTGARKPAVSNLAAQKELAAVVASFEKLQKDIKERKSGFAARIKKPGFDPQEAVRLDRMFDSAANSAAGLAEKHARIAVKTGKKNARPPAWPAKIKQLHNSWIKQTLNSGEQPQSSRNAHLASLRLMQVIMGRTQDEAAIAAYRPRLARLFQLSGLHADAVRAYMQLADSEGQPSRRISYLNNAAVSQSVLAAWPVTPPWLDVASGKNPGPGTAHTKIATRTELKDIYTRLANERGGRDNDSNWQLDAHAGLIDWVAGQQVAAIELWRQRLGSQAALRSGMASHRSQAGGFALKWYRQQKAWSDLESTARQAMSLNWRPMYGKNKINPVEMLGDALFEGGKAQLSGGESATAVAKLTEFTANFRKDRRFEEALFLRGKAERSARKFIEALETFKQFTTIFSRSRFDEEANRIGFELATDMADEEAGMAFGRRYVAIHGRKPAGRSITEAYASLAMGRGFYQEGVTTMEKLAQGESNKEARTAAMAKLMDLQNLIGQTGDALITAGKLQKMGSLPPEIQLRVARAQARAASAANNKVLILRARDDAMRANRAISDGDQQTRDALGEVLFIAAELKGRGEVDEVFNLEVRNPTAHLITQENKYNQVKAAYDSVCGTGRNLWCGPALYRTARVAERFREAAGDLSIADTLASEEVDSFNQKKAALLKRWTDEASAADAQAAELANQGIAAPGYTLTIQLGSGADLVLDDRTISGIHGYIQLDAR
jgi:hypothetical protein